MWEQTVESLMTKDVNRESRAHWHKAAGLRAIELMTSPAITISEKSTVSAAARLLAAKKVRRLCVVNLSGMLVGVISRRDIIATYLRDDAQILADIEDHVFRHGMWLFPGPQQDPFRDRRHREHRALTRGRPSP